MRRTLTVLALALVAVAGLGWPALAGGGGGHEAGRCPGFTEGERVLLRDGCIEGVGHFAPGGSDLTVENVGIAPHDYTAVDGSFATGLLQPGATATVEAPAPGVYRVYCTLHASARGQGMAGVLVVGDLGPEAVAAGAGSSGAAGGPGSGLWLVPLGAAAVLGVVAAVLGVGAAVRLASRHRPAGAAGTLAAEPRT